MNHSVKTTVRSVTRTALSLRTALKIGRRERAREKEILTAKSGQSIRHRKSSKTSSSWLGYRFGVLIPSEIRTNWRFRNKWKEIRLTWALSSDGTEHVPIARGRCSIPLLRFPKWRRRRNSLSYSLLELRFKSLNLLYMYKKSFKWPCQPPQKSWLSKRKYWVLRVLRIS